jgi:hypothetical protein
VKRKRRKVKQKEKKEKVNCAKEFEMFLIGVFES